MYRNLQVEAWRKQEALKFLTTEMARKTLCYSVNPNELDLLHLEALVRTIKLSPDDISCVIHDWLLEGKKQYIEAYYMRNEQRLREFLDNPYNSVVFSLACNNIDVHRAVAIWESISKRYLTEAEKSEVATALTPLMQACYNDLQSRCN